MTARSSQNVVLNKSWYVEFIIYSLHIQSECGKIWTRPEKAPYLDKFHAVLALPIRAYFLKIKEVECIENTKSKESEMKKLDTRWTWGISSGTDSCRRRRLICNQFTELSLKVVLKEWGFFASKGYLIRNLELMSSLVKM